jgi:hypothetical protein
MRHGRRLLQALNVYHALSLQLSKTGYPGGVQRRRPPVPAHSGGRGWAARASPFGRPTTQPKSGRQCRWSQAHRQGTPLYSINPLRAPTPYSGIGLGGNLTHTWPPFSLIRTTCGPSRSHCHDPVGHHRCHTEWSPRSKPTPTAPHRRCRPSFTPPSARLAHCCSWTPHGGARSSGCASRPCSAGTTRSTTTSRRTWTKSESQTAWTASRGLASPLTTSREANPRWSSRCRTTCTSQRRARRWCCRRTCAPWTSRPRATAPSW